VAPAPTQQNSSQNSSPPIIIPVQQAAGPTPAAIVLAILFVLLLGVLAGLITWLIMRRRAAAPVTPQAPVAGEWERIEHGEVEALQPPYLQSGYGQTTPPGEVYEGEGYQAPSYHDQPTVLGSATPPTPTPPPLPEQESSASPPNEDSHASRDGQPERQQWETNEPL
jgi:hypothetical protein